MGNEKKQLATDQLETLTLEQQQELLEKYDSESNTRRLMGIMKWVVFFGLLAFSLFQLYTAIFGQFTAYIQRTIHLGFGLTFIFLLFPARKKGSKTKIAFYDYILAILSAISGLYWTLNYERLVTSLGQINQLDFIVGLIVILLVLEGARRAVGLPIAIIAVLFLLYAFFGRNMPDFISHRGQSLESIVNLMYFSTDGILGTPIS
ncbi:hypothetical protein RhiirA1_485359, partial [Rhizophagus irregularis]